MIGAVTSGSPQGVGQRVEFLAIVKGGFPCHAADEIIVIVIEDGE
jgi:hypothetical protein